MGRLWFICRFHPQSVCSPDGVISTNFELFPRLREARHAGLSDLCQTRRLYPGWLTGRCPRRRSGVTGQDYLFLISLRAGLRTGGLQGRHSGPTFRDAAAGIPCRSVDVEIALHVEYCAAWGLMRPPWRSLPEGKRRPMPIPAYVLRKGRAGAIARPLTLRLPRLHIGFMAEDRGAGWWRIRRTRRDDNPYLAGRDVCPERRVIRPAVHWPTGAAPRPPLKSRGRRRTLSPSRRTFEQATR